MEEILTIKEIEDYVKNLKFLGNPVFCQTCVPIRATSNKTFLDAYEQLLYNNRGMCTKCFEYLNNPENDTDELKKRMKIWEDTMEYKLRK